MDWKWSIFLIIIIVVNKLLEKKFPRFFKQIELPFAIVASGLIIIFCSFPLYGVYDVLTSEVSNGDKVFFTIFIGCIVAVNVVIMVLMWKNRFKGRKQ